MHDLSTIHKLNAEQFLESAEKARSGGKHVLVTYDGQHVTGFETFSNDADAMNALQNAQSAAGASNHFVILAPASEGQPAVDVHASRPRLLDGEPDDPIVNEQQAELTAEEEGQLVVAAQQRDRALTALQAAAFAYTKAQDECTALAQTLRARIEKQARELQPQLFQ